MSTMKLAPLLLLFAVACTKGDDSSTPSDDVVDTGPFDADSDGVPAADDCDDDDADVGLPSTFYVDDDGDHYGTTVTTTACAAPSGYAAATGDCDDTADAVHPGATETWYDGVDADCLGDNDYDQDHDGFVGVDYGNYYGGTAPDVGDCDDTVASTNPEASEAFYDGIDADCDGKNDYDADADGFVDEDHDGFAGGSAPNTGDCLDTDRKVYPGAAELCDGKDNDCDDAIDDDVQTVTWYADADTDGYGDAASTTESCSEPTGYVDNDLDCNDGPGNSGAFPPAQVNPGATETYYDGVDQNCDAKNDWDRDGDTYVPTTHAAHAGGSAPNTGDCDDQRGAVHPGAPETWYDGLDADCLADNDYDQDHDTYVATAHPTRAGGTAPNTGDCVDLPAGTGAIAGNLIRPGATETWYDGVDQDCAGDSDYDQDHDAHTVTTAPAGQGTRDDCLDTDAAVFPGATEKCDGAPNACVALPATEVDNDGDGYVECAIDAGGWRGTPVPTGGGDCDDTPGNGATVHPGATERCDGLANACTTLPATERDDDGDGFVECTIDAGGWDATPSKQGGDCNDATGNGATVYPAAPELCDGIVNACGTALRAVEIDDDGDGFVECVLDVGGWDATPSKQGGDCTDTGMVFDVLAADIHPGATEVCNYADDNCNQQTDEGLTVTAWADWDGDGYGGPDRGEVCAPLEPPMVLNGDDCEEDNPIIHPGAMEFCDGVDRDCNPQTAATSCLESCLAYKEVEPLLPDGLYRIDPEGVGTVAGAIPTWCEMTQDGGGYTMIVRSIWDDTANGPLMTGYASWYADRVGDATPGTTYRIPGRYLDELTVDGDHMIRTRFIPNSNYPNLVSPDFWHKNEDGWFGDTSGGTTIPVPTTPQTKWAVLSSSLKQSFQCGIPGSPHLCAPLIAITPPHLSYVLSTTDPGGPGRDIVTADMLPQFYESTSFPTTFYLGIDSAFWLTPDNDVGRYPTADGRAVGCAEGGYPDMGGLCMTHEVTTWRVVGSRTAYALEFLEWYVR